jgi:hypothetical protein
MFMAFGSPASKGLYFADFPIFEGTSSMLFQKSVVRGTEFNIYVFILPQIIHDLFKHSLW